jgi:hypothetical protein
MVSPTEYLLIITEDGFGKRVPLSEIPCTKGRGGLGAIVSKHDIAAALVVSDDDTDLLIASTGGIVQRVALSDVRVVRRGNSHRKASRGVRVMTLDAGDAVATAAVAAEIDAGDREGPPPAIRAAEWPGGRVALRDGERTRAEVVFAPLREWDDPPTGDLVGDQDPAIAAMSSYWCVRCGAEHPDAESVYGCLDNHAAQRSQVAA